MKFWQQYRDDRYVPPELEAWFTNTLAYGVLYFSISTKTGTWVEVRHVQPDVFSLHE